MRTDQIVPDPHDERVGVDPETGDLYRRIGDPVPLPDGGVEWIAGDPAWIVFRNCWIRVPTES